MIGVPEVIVILSPFAIVGVIIYEIISHMRENDKQKGEEK